MAKPITWRSVNAPSMNPTSALSTAIQGFTRSGQGFDSLTDQMNKLVTREDEQLTNEAISAALSGGPQVSNNRRVDAGVLQKAVNTQGRHDLDMRLGGLDESIKQFTVDNQEEKFQMDRDLAEARIRAQNAAGDLSKHKVDDLLRAREEQDAFLTSYGQLNEMMYGGGIDEAYATEWEKAAKDRNLDPNDTLARDQFIQSRKDEDMGSMDFWLKEAHRVGMRPDQFFKTPQGERLLDAQKASDAATAERVARETEAEDDMYEAAAAYNMDGDTSTAIRDPNAPGGVRFQAGGESVTENDIKVIAKELGLDPEDDDVASVLDAMKTYFPNKTGFKDTLSTLMVDGEMPEGMAARVSQWAESTTNYANSLIKNRYKTPQGTGDAYADLDNYVKAGESGENQRTTPEGYNSRNDSLLDDLRDNPELSATQRLRLRLLDEEQARIEEALAAGATGDELLQDQTTLEERINALLKQVERDK